MRIAALIFALVWSVYCDYSCSNSTLNFMNGARHQIGPVSTVPCEHGCLTKVIREEDGSLTMRGQCAWMLLPNTRHAGCNIDDEGHGQCRCDSNNCNAIGTDEEAKKLADRYVVLMLTHKQEKDGERRGHELTLLCKQFSFLYKWDEVKITTHLQSPTDLSCEKKRCYIHVEKHEYYVSKISGGCEGTITKDYTMHGDVLEYVCDSANCNELKDADAAEGYYELWRDHHPLSMENNPKKSES